MRRLPPLREHPDVWQGLEERLRHWIRDQVYRPFLQATKMPRRTDNALSDLVAAIAAGEVQYVRGHFEGKMTAKLSRELKKIGATWDRRRRWWSLPERELPDDIRSAIGTSYSKFQAMAERARKALDEMKPDEFPLPDDLASHFDKAIFTMDHQFRENVKKVGIVPELGSDVKERIASDYTRSTKLDIRGWAREEIDRLREAVNRNTFEGGLRAGSLEGDVAARLLEKRGLKPGVRLTGLSDDVRKSYEKVGRKARFIARQETSLLMAKFQRARCLDAGLPRYQWDCVNNPPGPRNAAPVKHAVRWDHWDLRGQIFRWDSPPVVDKRSGRRGHPKEDFNCRCVAIPIME